MKKWKEIFKGKAYILYCDNRSSSWEEARIDIDGTKDLVRLFKDYLEIERDYLCVSKEVKIKVRKGCIQIERVKK